MTLTFVGGEPLQRGRGLGGLLRLVKSVFTPIAKTAVKAAKSNTGKAIFKALKEQAIDSSVNLASDALRGNNIKESFQNEVESIRQNTANTLEGLKSRPRVNKRKRKAFQKGRGSIDPSKKLKRTKNGRKPKRVSKSTRKTKTKKISKSKGLLL